MITRVFSKYTFKARLLPIILCAIPFLIIQYLFIGPGFSAKLPWIDEYPLVWYSASFSAIGYLLSFINRIIAKSIFEKSESFMPTTEFMLYSNGEFSPEYKEKLYKKIKSDFDFVLPDASEQLKNEVSSRKRIAEGIGFVRKKVGNGELLLQHNIEYGFLRNLAGASLVSEVIVSLLLVSKYFMGVPIIPTWVLVVLIIIYLIPLIIHMIYNKEIAALYARTLFSEYLANTPKER